MDMKTCSKCKKILPMRLFFSKDISQSGGLSYKCKSCVKKKNAIYYEKNRTHLVSNWRKNELMRKYNLTIADYEITLAKQNGKCAICLSSEHKGRGHFYVDHDHSTGKLRGLLCNPCNIALGMFRDSIETLQAAVRYLECHSPTSAQHANDVKIYAELASDSKKTE